MMGKALGIGILGLGVLCMLLNATADVCYLDEFKDGNVDDWTRNASGGGNIQCYPDWHMPDQKSLYVASFVGHSTKAWAKSPDLSTYANKDYNIDMYVNIPTSDNHWFYILYNGNIKCFIDYGTDLKVWYDGCAHLVKKLTADTWTRLNFNVDLNEAGKGKHYHLTVGTTEKGPFSFDSPTATSNLYMGDDEETDSNYGSAYFDNLNVNDVIFRDNFNSADRGIWRTQWAWDFTAGGYANIYMTSAKANADAGSYSLDIDAPDYWSIAWAFTPTYTINNGKTYTVSFCFYIEDECLYFYLPYNGHIRMWVDPDRNLRYFDNNDNTEKTVASLTKHTWYYLKIVVDPTIIQQVKPHVTYDVYVNNNLAKSGLRAHFDTANKFLAFGDDTADYNWGRVFLNDVRVDGSPS